MSNSILENKGFRTQSEAVAISAKILISKIRKHVEEDECRCCREALEND